MQYTDNKGGDVEKHKLVSEEWVKKEAGFPNDVINHAKPWFWQKLFSPSTRYVGASWEQENHTSKVCSRTET